MSCSTTSLSCTIKNTLTAEDPYVFTETAPVTPPSLFNNSQKSRNRLVVKHVSISPTAKVDKTQPSCAKIKYNAAKTQTALANATQKSATLSSSGVLGVLNTNNIKYVSQTLKQQLDSNQTKYTPQNENAAANVQTSTAVSRNGQQQQKPPLLQQKAQQPQHQQQQSQTPPPFILSHTPSLWQTPLLLESPATMESSSSSSSTLPAASLAKTTSSAMSPVTVIKNVAVPTSFVSTLRRQPIKISFQQTTTPTVSAAAIFTPITIAATSAANASIAPIQLIMPSAAPLPPSNFHSTTLAQHLQKVQCLKKSKKPTASSTFVANVAPQKLETTSAKNVTKNNKTQHSTNDLNDIPVNVIFRSPTKANSADSNSPNDAQNSNNNNVVKCPPPTQTIFQTNGGNKKTPLGVAIVSNHSIQQQSSKAPQKRKLSTGEGQHQLSQPKQRKLQRPSVKAATKVVVAQQQQHQQQQTILTSELISVVPSNAFPLPLPPKTNKTNSKRKQNKVSQKSKKLNQKVSFPTKQKGNTERGDQHDFALAPNEFSSATLTKAVAVIRMPRKETEEDISQLADEAILPYCVQRHWFNPHERAIRSTEMGREQRIIECKHLLRRQAMQLLATKSLQKVPFHIARRRLICVDELLRKYRDHNKTAISGTVRKTCEVESCPNVVMELSTYCQQHIVKNTKQCLFVQCSAKNLRDIHKPCDIPVLNIEKPYSAPLCYLHAEKRRNSNAANEATNSFLIATQPKTKQRATTCRRRKAATENTILPMRSADDPKDSINSVLNTVVNAVAADAHTPNSFQTNMLSPPTSFVPLSYNKANNINNNSNNICNINSVRNTEINSNSLVDDFTDSSHHTASSSIFGSGTIDPTAEQEINKLVAQFAMAAAASATATATASNSSNSSNNTNYNSNNNNIANNNHNQNNNSFSYMNTNSNSNLTSSGVGSSSSLPSTDELLTQDMLSICENSSAYASSEDTGLGELSENELIGASVGGVGGVVVGIGGGGGIGLNDDDVSPDEIPLGDTRLLEENDLVNVFGALPVNINELFNAVVRQDERDEVERALEMADKHLKTLQETIGSDSDFLADFLDVNDDMLADTDDIDIVNKMEIVSSVLSPPESLESTTKLYLENTDSGLNMNLHGSTGAAMNGNCVGAGNTTNTPPIMDIRGLLQT